MSVLEIERADGYAVLTLNRPEQKNALSRALRAALSEAIDSFAGDPGVRVLILTGAGGTFCAGLDLKEIGGSDAALQAALTEAPVVDAMARFPGPVIGAIHGAALTGGFELALGCDLLVAGESARFADTHGRVGLLPVWGLSQRLSRLIGPAHAKEMSLTGNFIGAQQALAWGLVNRVVPDAALLDVARTLALDMGSLAPGMLCAYKRLIDQGFGQPLSEALAFERREAMAFDAAVSCQAVEANRLAVVARGRQQSVSGNPGAKRSHG
jgi:enoyl-CoA hydratase